MGYKKPQSYYILTEIAKKAREAGLSYGKYVAKYPQPALIKVNTKSPVKIVR